MQLSYYRGATGMAAWLLLHVSAFSVQTIHRQRSLGLLSTAKAQVEDTENSHVLPERLFQTAEFVEVTLPEHKPLGCTVEESLASVTVELADMKAQKLDYVFVSDILAGGNAEKAGLLLGDVIVGVTGVFGGFENIVGLGIEKVKGLVGARSEDQPLTIRIARGTSVMADHERFIVDLCDDLDGKEAEECIVSFLKQGYELGNDSDTEDDDSEAVAYIINGEEMDFDTESTQRIDEDDLVSNMYNMWAQDIAFSHQSSDDSVIPGKGEEPLPKPKPWSSRSSPSGTFVRDPKTGKINNIDS